MTITSAFLTRAFELGRMSAFVGGRFIQVVVAEATRAKIMLFLVVLEARVLAFMEMASNPILPHVMEE